MISHGVEISIARGGADEKDGTHTLDGSPLKIGGNKRGPIPGMSAGRPRTEAGRGLPEKYPPGPVTNTTSGSKPPPQHESQDGHSSRSPIPEHRIQRGTCHATIQGRGT